MSPTTITLSFPEPDIGLLTFDLPGRAVNLLSRPTLDELAAHLDTLVARPDLAGVILASGKPDTFIAGADLRDLAIRLKTITPDQARAASRRGQELFARLTSLPAVSVAIVAGVCLGGGAELASWCDRRLVADSERVEVGFPEVQLGIVPGWGGTVRLPRLIGLGPAIEWIATGQRFDAAAVRRAGWADEVVPRDDLLTAAIRRIRDERSTGAYLRDRVERAAPLSISSDELSLLRLSAAAHLRHAGKGQTHVAESAVELLIEAATHTAAEAAGLESRRLAELMCAPLPAALVNVFLLRERVNRDIVSADGQPSPRRVNLVGVIGAGIMGSGITAAHLKREVPVMLTDAAPESLSRAAAAILEEVAFDRRTKAPDPQRALKLAPLLRTAPDAVDLAKCDLVIEAIVESAEAKRAVFSRLEPLLAPDAILATNTSTIPVSHLAARLERPDRFCGMHYFNPVRRMQLVEVIRGQQTSDATIAAVVAHARRIGKLPIVVRDGPGFLVNRMLFPYMNEAIELLSDGAEIMAVEQAAKQFGMPVGPLELYDMVGLDTAMYAGRVIWEAFPNRIRPLPVIPALMKAGRLGQKSGRGFFAYDQQHHGPKIDPTVQPILDTYRRDQRQFTTDELTTRLFMPMLLEATRVLEDQIVADARDVDFGLVFGLGFPAFRGGLLYWADQLGADRVLARIEPLAALGVRFEPTPLLRDMAATGKSFYGEAPARLPVGDAP